MITLSVITYCGFHWYLIINIFEVNSLNNLYFDSTVYNIFFIVKVLIGQIMSGRIYI